ncbi:MAG: archaemetzincin family Zn-dependent metalloprotease [Candidatus Bathyarchaeota archaeon]
MKGLKIHFFLVGNFREEIIEEAMFHIKKVFPNSNCIKDLSDQSILEGSYNSQRDQYDANVIFGRFSAEARKIKADRVLALVNVDLYIDGLNFIFGQALSPGQLAIVSTHRLSSEYYGGSDGSILVNRVQKEIVHEIGHTLDLSHCGNPRCVMFFSNNIEMTDKKESVLCPFCNVSLHKNMRKMGYME